MRHMIEDFFRKGDLLLLMLCNLASIFGLVLIYTATNYWESNDKALLVQGVAILLGNLAFALLTVLDMERFMTRCWKFVFFFNLAFMILLKEVGTSHGSGNHNWIEIPLLGVDIQPNEIIKSTFILILAYHMSHIQKENRRINHPLALGILAFHSLFPIGLVAYICGDWGMCVVYIAIALTMLWCGGVSVYLFALGAGVVVTAVHIIWVYYLPYSAGWDIDYRILRFRNVLDHSVDPNGVGWQPTRSITAIGSGQFSGQGYLQGTQSQSSNMLPARHTDFIFSVCGEELGFVGCVLLLALLMGIVLRCIWIALEADQYFSAYVAIGVASMLVAQIFINVGMCLYILPTMGLTLPFVSYGGSSVVTLYLSMGIVSSLKSSKLPSWIRH